MQYIEVKASGSCMFKESRFDVTIDDKTTVSIREKNNKYYYKQDNSHIDVDVCVNNLGNSKMESGHQAFITITIKNSQSNKNWMYRLNQASNNAFFRKKLNQVCLPGAHDAGMSELHESTAFSDECNTKTQKHSILTQLNDGVRYFDLRPALWDKHRNTIHMGHFSKLVGVVEGSTGQTLNDVLNSVASFMRNDSTRKEIVVLKFSHYMTQDKSGFNKDLLNKLINQIKGTLGAYMYTNINSSVNLGNLTLNDIANTGRRVICVFDDDPDDKGFSSHDFNNVVNSSQGIFTFGGHTSSKNFRLYDHYANDHDYDDMVKDQVKKWDDYSPSSGGMFLFSYTLTSTSGGLPIGTAQDAEDHDLLRDCVLDMAKSANPVLLANLAYYRRKRNIRTIPNILYIDRVTSEHPVNEALYINCLYL
jgi:hypothetical protein